LSDESLFREVDEEVRRDQAQKLWNRYGNYVVALSLGVIIAVAGVKGWQYYAQQRAEAAGQAYFNALKAERDGKSAEDVTAAFAAVEKAGHPGFGKLVKLDAAADLARRGERDKAVAAYDAFAADATNDPALRQAASIRAAYLLADTATSADLVSRLSALDRPDSPWRLAVREIYALAAWREGKFDEANRLVNEILADPAASEGLRQRAQIIAAVVQPKLPRTQ
jgi:hypothetical protein